MAYELQTALEFNRDRILKKQPDQLIKARLQILAGQKDNPEQKEKINLIFLLDSSGSMDEKYYNTGKTKRDVVFESINQLIDIIDNKDTVSIISFNAQAILHADHLPGSAKTGIRQALNLYLQDYGATNFEQPMKMAQSVVQKRKKENHKIIFLTDGHSVSGNNGTAFNICKDLAKSGITTDSMGIGEDFKFDFMKRFSDYSGSITENITELMSPTQVFKTIYVNTTNVFLKKVFINIQFVQTVRDVHFYMHEPEQKNLSEFIHHDKNGTMIQINAGDIEQQMFKDFLFDFTLDTPNAPSMKIGESLIHFDCPSENIVNQEEKQQLYLNFSDTLDEEIIDSSIEQSYKDIEILEHQNNLFKLIKQEKYKEAAIRLEDMAVLAEQIDDFDKAKAFREKKNDLMRGQNLTQADLNTIAYTSSRSSVKSRIQSRQQTDSVLF